MLLYLKNYYPSIVVDNRVTHDELVEIRELHNDMDNNMSYVWTPVGITANIHREKLLDYIDELHIKISELNKTDVDQL